VKGIHPGGESGAFVIYAVANVGGDKEAARFQVIVDCAKLRDGDAFAVPRVRRMKDRRELRRLVFIVHAIDRKPCAALG
jgi:hypothetical protein